GPLSVLDHRLADRDDRRGARHRRAAACTVGGNDRAWCNEHSGVHRRRGASHVRIGNVFLLDMIAEALIGAAILARFLRSSSSTVATAITTEEPMGLLAYR